MTFFNSYFSNTQVLLLIIGAFFFLLSLIFQLRNKQALSIVLLALSAVGIFSFAALLDPFLNIWDERFHALVAKNLINHPLMPTLYDDPVVNTLYDRWDRYHIWLHKQPLFLWQIALSFAIFGESEFVLRLPNIVLGTVFVIITYRSGKLLANPQVGYIAAAFSMSTLYIIELISGRQELDHNDFTFLVYISLSIWSFIEYYYSKEKKWIFLIGLFSGMAILCKWLVGLLVYFGWFVLRIMQKEFKISHNKDIFIALSITLLVALPWQILTFIWYPGEASKAYLFNALHVTVPLDGHVGSFWYHFNTFNVIYGTFASFLIIPAFLVLTKITRDNKIFGSLLGMVLVVYVFFSFVSTKMPSFTVVAAMIIFIAFGALFQYCVNYLNQFIKNNNVRKAVIFLSIIIIVFMKFDIEFLQEKHTQWKGNNSYTRMLTHNKQIFKSLDLSDNTVLFNVKGRHYIEAMFYTGLPAYNFVPSHEQYLDLKQKGRNIAIFKAQNKEFPDYLKNDSTIIIIDKNLKGYE